MKIYIASSWKNQHAVTMLTNLLRGQGHEVLSFVENNHGEGPTSKIDINGRQVSLENWVWSDAGNRSFDYDTKGATKSDAVIYIGPSGCDAWAEVGAAWASNVPVFGLISKGEQVGLMRRMVRWFDTTAELLMFTGQFAAVLHRSKQT